MKKGDNGTFQRKEEKTAFLFLESDGRKSGEFKNSVDKLPPG